MEPVSNALMIAALSGALFGASSAHAIQPSGNGAVSTPRAQTHVSFATSDRHACKGQNTCKGQGGCKTDKHACKGQNTCKGQGGCKTS